MLKAFLLTVIKNIAGMLITRKVLIWALRLAADQTKNGIDDNIVEIVDAAYLDDGERFMKGFEAIAREFKKNEKNT